MRRSPCVTPSRVRAETLGFRGLVLGALLPCLACGADSPSEVVDPGDDTSTEAGSSTSPTPSTTALDTTDAEGTSAAPSTGPIDDTITGDGTTQGSGTCGDGMLDPGEACDDAGETAACNADCTASACGDGTHNATALELCDDGNLDDFDFCSNLCAPAPAYVLGGMHVFDTDLGVLDGVAQASWDPTTSTWYLTGLQLDATGTLTVVGTAPFVLRVEGEVVIAGTLNAAGDDGTNPSGGGIDCSSAGQGGLGGPGGFDGGDGAGLGGSGTETGQPGEGPGMFPATGGNATAVFDLPYGAAGGGGGGHLVAGNNGLGNNGGVGGTGGEPHASLPPLVGGGGGGGGSVEKDGVLGAGLDPIDDEGAGGGGGGGVVAIEATVSLTVTGVIDASGGNGGNDAGCEGATGGGGGGAGGSIQLVSPAIAVGTGVLDVAGGLGGVSVYGDDAVNLRGGNGAVGRVVVM